MMGKNLIIKKQLNNRIAYKLSQIRLFYRIVTPKKLKNFLLANYEYRFKKIRLKSLPYLAQIEPTNACNLKCPKCPNRLNRRKISFMSFGTFKKIIDEMEDYLFSVGVFNMGEPFLDKDIFEMIKYAESKNIKTHLNSNMILINEKNVDDLINSGLKYITMSIDGASQETYSKYRKGGDFDRLIENIKLIIQKKREYKTHFPFLEYKFIVFKHNEHEINKAEKMAKDIGIDFFTLSPSCVYTPISHKLDKEALSMASSKINQMHDGNNSNKNGCYWLYKWLIVNADGGASCCCGSNKKKNDFGNVFEEDIKDIWNNQYFVSARSIFNYKKKKPKIDNVKLSRLTSEASFSWAYS